MMMYGRRVTHLSIFTRRIYFNSHILLWCIATYAIHWILRRFGHVPWLLNYAWRAQLVRQIPLWDDDYPPHPSLWRLRKLQVRGIATLSLEMDVRKQEFPLSLHRTPFECWGARSRSATPRVSQASTAHLWCLLEERRLSPPSLLKGRKFEPDVIPRKIPHPFG